MPQVESTETTSEESKQQLEAQESLHSNVLERIKGGDVFKSVTKELVPEDSQNEQRPDEVTDVQGSKEPIRDSQEEQSQDENQQEDSQDDNEEVIPKSKVQARFDQLTATIKRLEQRVAEKETAAPVDDIQRQLDDMNEDTLEDTLTQVRVAKEKARDDDAKLLELVKLERRIEKTIVQAPQKFISNQVSELNKVAERLSSSGDINNSNSQKILEIAKGIYDKYPKMQKAIDGQAMALELAVEHYKEMSKSSLVKTDTQNLKGQLNNLKKKTTLDTKNVKSGGDKINLDKLRSNALNGTMKDKERFAQNDSRFKIDAMIPDFLKG